MVLWSFRAINYSKTNLMQWTDVALFFRKEFKTEWAHLDIAGLDGQHFRKPMEISRPVLANVKQELFVEEEPKNVQPMTTLVLQAHLFCESCPGSFTKVKYLTEHQKKCHSVQRKDPERLHTRHMSRVNLFHNVFF